MTTHPLTTVTAYGRGAGSARVRVFDWIDHLGIDAVSLDYLGSSRLGARALLSSPGGVLAAEARLRRAQATVAQHPLLLSRQASPLSNGRIERQLLSKARLGVYDVDDALYAHPVTARERIWSRRRIWHASIGAADVVIAGNDELASAADSIARRVVIIPSCVEPGDYTVKGDYTISEPPRAVWLGSPSTESYLLAITDSLLELNRSRGLRVTVISAGAAPLGSLSPIVDRVPWSHETARAHLVAADIGIMPLDDTEWSRGKCAYKLLQYGASGLPMVGSPVGANRNVLRAASAPAPESADDWVGALEAVLDAPESERELAGRRALSVVHESYSFEAWAPQWRSATGLDQ